MVEDKDIIPWWKIKKTDFPLMYELARFVFAVPASSAAAESNLSIAKLVATDGRSSLNPQTIEGKLIQRSNFDLVNFNVGEY